MNTDKEKNKCPNDVVAIVPWAGKILKGCEQHIRTLVVLGSAMGSSVEARELPPNKDKCEFQDDL